MKLTIQLLQNYVLQECPSIIITSGNSKYIFNVPSTFQRFLKDHKVKITKGFNYFFTKSSTQTVAGLNGFMLTIFQAGSIDSKLFLNRDMFQYLQDARYKMGFKILPFSYLDFNSLGQKNRLGINDLSIIKQLVKRQDFTQIFDDLDIFIRKQYNQKIINDSKKLINMDIQGFKDQQLEIIPFQIKSNNQLIMNFVFRGKPIAGKVLIQKIRQYGIPQKFIGKILQADTFKLANSDKIIKVSDIKENDKPGPIFFLIHINSIESINKILQNIIFKKYSQGQPQLIQCVIYIVQQTSYVLSQQFKILLKSFPQKTQHILNAPNFVDKNFRIDSFIKPHMQITSLLSQRFPLCMPNILKIHQNFMLNYKKESKTVQQYFNGYQFCVPQRCDEICFVPIKSRGIKLNKQKLPACEGLQHITQKNQKMFKEMQIQILDHKNNKMQIQLPFNSQKCDPKVIFLGTGSMKPGTYRNVSSILIQMNSQNSFMLDCGQSSMYQLMNHYRIQQADQRLLNIRVIFITHIHSDHNLGILDLIGRRNRLMKKYNQQNRKLYLIIPCNVYPWYYSFLKHIEDLSQGCQLLFIQTLRNQIYHLGQATMSKDQRCKTKQQSQKVTKMISQDQEIQQQQYKQQQKQLEIIEQMSKEKSVERLKALQNQNGQNQDTSDVKTKKYHFKIQQVMNLFKIQQEKQPKILKDFEEYLKSIGVNSFYPTPVIHCPQSYGITIQNKEANVKISYSGDTRPSQQFAKAALNSTIMIHQATFGDQLAKNAYQNYHSTVGQAMNIGMISNSWKTALTHFSQRYVSAKHITDIKNYNSKKEMQDYLINHTLICFDHLQVKLSNAGKYPMLTQGIAKSIIADD